MIATSFSPTSTSGSPTHPGNISRKHTTLAVCTDDDATTTTPQPTTASSMTPKQSKPVTSTPRSQKKWMEIELQEGRKLAQMSVPLLFPPEKIYLGVSLKENDRGEQVAVSIDKDSPADIAGLLPGCAILKIDGVDIKGLSDPEVRDLTYHFKDKTLNLMIRQPGATQVVEIIVRYRHRSQACQKEAGLLEEAEDFVNMCSNVIFWGHKEGKAHYQKQWAESKEMSAEQHKAIWAKQGISGADLDDTEGHAKEMDLEGLKNEYTLAHLLPADIKYLGSHSIEMLRSDKGTVGLSFFRNGGQTSGPWHILEIAPNSPAENSGCLRVGDAILAVDGKSVLNLGEQETVGLFSGLPRSKVTVLLQADLEMHAKVKEFSRFSGDRPSGSRNVGTGSVGLERWGVGCTLERRHGSGDVFILNVKPGGGCEKAGVQSGSKVTAVDGKLLKGMQIREIRELCLGPPASKTVLSIVEHGKTIDKTVWRLNHTQMSGGHRSAPVSKSEQEKELQEKLAALERRAEAEKEALERSFQEKMAVLEKANGKEKEERERLTAAALESAAHRAAAALQTEAAINLRLASEKSALQSAQLHTARDLQSEVMLLSEVNAKNAFQAQEFSSQLAKERALKNEAMAELEKERARVAFLTAQLTQDSKEKDSKRITRQSQVLYDDTRRAQQDEERRMKQRQEEAEIKRLERERAEQQHKERRESERAERERAASEAAEQQVEDAVRHIVTRNSNTRSSALQKLVRSSDGALSQGLSKSNLEERPQIEEKPMSRVHSQDVCSDSNTPRKALSPNANTKETELQWWALLTAQDASHTSNIHKKASEENTTVRPSAIQSLEEDELVQLARRMMIEQVSPEWKGTYYRAPQAEAVADKSASFDELNRKLEDMDKTVRAMGDPSVSKR